MSGTAHIWGWSFHTGGPPCAWWETSQCVWPGGHTFFPVVTTTDFPRHVACPLTGVQNSPGLARVWKPQNPEAFPLRTGPSHQDWERHRHLSWRPCSLLSPGGGPGGWCGLVRVSGCSAGGGGALQALQQLVIAL